MPIPPETPALNNPECLSEVDRIALAGFYRDYEKYLAKMEVFKNELFK